MNKELLEAMEVLEKEKNISKDTMIEAIENSLITACKNHFGKADNVKVTMNRETGDFAVYAEKTVVEEVEDPIMEISLEDAKKMIDLEREKALNDLRASVTGLAMTATAKLLSEQAGPESDKKRYQAFLASAGEKHD